MPCPAYWAAQDRWFWILKWRQIHGFANLDSEDGPSISKSLCICILTEERLFCGCSALVSLHRWCGLHLFGKCSWPAVIAKEWLYDSAALVITYGHVSFSCHNNCSIRVSAKPFQHLNLKTCWSWKGLTIEVHDAKGAVSKFRSTDNHNDDHNILQIMGIISIDSAALSFSQLLAESWLAAFVVTSVSLELHGWWLYSEWVFF